MWESANNVDLVGRQTLRRADGIVVSERGHILTMTRATMEVHPFFAEVPPFIWELKTSPPKTDLEKNKTTTG